MPIESDGNEYCYYHEVFYDKPTPGGKEECLSICSGMKNCKYASFWKYDYTNRCVLTPTCTSRSVETYSTIVIYYKRRQGKVHNYYFFHALGQISKGYTIIKNYPVGITPDASYQCCLKFDGVATIETVMFFQNVASFFGE